MNEKKTNLDWALEYHRAGINVVKAYYKGKHPAKGEEWEPYQAERVSEEQLNEWFGADASHGNISVVTGPISGGLTVIDFDDVKIYQAWGRKYPELKDSLPTTKSGRGYHVFIRSELNKDDTSTFTGIDIKAKGLVSLPPSTHKSGTRYEWIVPLPQNVSETPLLDPYQLGLEYFTDGIDGIDGSEGKDGKEGGCESECEGIAGLSALSQQAVEKAIDQTLPTGYGQRHSRLFLFARMLKAIEEIKEKSADDLMFILDKWHKKALPNIEHKSLLMTQERFRNAWEVAKYPPGEGKSLQIAWENAQKSKAHIPELKKYEDDEYVCNVIRLCFELQKMAGPDAEWFLPTNKARELFGISHSWLATLLKSLVREGVIKQVKQYTRTRCTRYVYLGNANI
jgi:hypothetical protein